MGYNYVTVERGSAKTQRRKPQLSSEKARKKLLGAREHKESPQEYRDREDVLHTSSVQKYSKCWRN